MFLIFKKDDIMKIFYGVQGTGNGHITRARVMAKALQTSSLEVDWLFSGRSTATDSYFDMDDFGNYKTREGLTYITNNGQIDQWQTARKIRFGQFIRDVKALDLSSYDLVVSDFEPISAWAAKIQGIKTIGLSHQSSFYYDIPKRGNNFLANMIMKWFAPVDIPLGLHWHHYDGMILPPMIETETEHKVAVRQRHHLVYFPFHSLDFLIELLSPFCGHHFYIYHGVGKSEDIGHLHIRPFSRTGFQADLHRVEGVICGAGFELPSEALQLGKQLLVQPIRGQMEQLSNGEALKKLGLAHVCDSFTQESVSLWLDHVNSPNNKPIMQDYPNVANALVKWFEQGDFSNPRKLVNQLWQASSTPSPSTPNKSTCLSTAA